MGDTRKRVVITGAGLITPVGIGLADTWDALSAGKSGIGPITRFDAGDHVTQIAGEVNGFNAEDYMDKKEAKRTQPFMAFAVAAAKMALSHAELTIDDALAPRIGVITGCGLGGLSSLEQTTLTVYTKSPKRVSPFFIPTMIGNMSAGAISIHVGAKGPNATLATACAAGAHAVGEAYEAILNGHADAMITGGVESVITPACIAGFNAMKALSSRNDAPQRASRPFDRDRDGFVVGEGAGMMVIERLDRALDRGAPIIAELVGYGMSGDAYHMASPSPEGEGAARCMQAALDNAGLAPADIDYINAHGTSTPLNDLYETQAIKSVFGEHAYRLAVSSTKSMTGHLLGGAGGVETALTALMVANGLILPTINLEHPSDDCDLDYVPNTARPAAITYAMTNSFGFGGTNAALILGRAPAA